MRTYGKISVPSPEGAVVGGSAVAVEVAVTRNFVQVSRRLSAARRALRVLLAAMMVLRMRLYWRFSQIKWLLLSVTRLSRPPPFLGGRCGADGNGGDEKERGQNVSLLMNEEGSGGEGGGGCRHDARASDSEASKTVTFAADYVPVPVNAVIVFVFVDTVTAFVVLFVRCWTSC